MTRITQARLHELFDYSVVTGLLYSRTARGRFGRTPAGSPLACPKLFLPNGRPRYNLFTVDGEPIYMHRAIWLWVTGELPANVDHENRDVTCNAWHNLRDSTVSENGCNRTKQSNNKSGYKGVCYRKDKGCWSARIGFRGTYYNLGNFSTPEAARDAYTAKCIELHGEFARHD